MVTWVELVDAEAESQPSNPCRRQRWQTFEAVIVLPLALMSGTGPGCVKTQTLNLRLELPIRFRRCRNQSHR
jgi:hypothetical protein